MQLVSYLIRYILVFYSVAVFISRLEWFWQYLKILFPKSHFTTWWAFVFHFWSEFFINDIVPFVEQISIFNATKCLTQRFWNFIPLTKAHKSHYPCDQNITSTYSVFQNSVNLVWMFWVLKNTLAAQILLANLGRIFNYWSEAIHQAMVPLLR